MRMNRILPIVLLATMSVAAIPAEADVVKLKEAKTVQGQSVKIMVKDGKVSVDGATVTATDIAATNGVIHVIDSVMMPK